MLTEFALNDIVQLKKPHACGANEWLVTRMGADIKIKCCQCGRLIMLDRAEFERRGKKVLRKAEVPCGSPDDKR